MMVTCYHCAPDPDAVRDNAVRSLSRAALATGRAAIDRGIRPDKFIAKSWPDDKDAGLILKASVGPLMREDAPALLQISLAFLGALTPQSAATDLFGRALSVSFGNGIGAVAVPNLPIPSASFVREAEAIPVVEASPATAAVLTAKKIKGHRGGNC